MGKTELFDKIKIIIRSLKTKINTSNNPLRKLKNKSRKIISY